MAIVMVLKDLENAFESLQYTIIWRKLRCNGMLEKLIYFTQAIYNNSTCQFKAVVSCLKDNIVNLSYLNDICHNRINFNNT